METDGRSCSACNVACCRGELICTGGKFENDMQISKVNCRLISTRRRGEARTWPATRRGPPRCSPRVVAFRFLEYPELELSNNPAENSMRPVAVGRRNWIHVGSAQAGPKIAAILSIVESCRRLKIPVREYLGAILPGIADTPVSRLRELTPGSWGLQRR